MRHFTIERWSDFVRGCVEPARREVMEQHLAAGCRRCETTVAALRRTAALGASEGASEPPAAALRSAKALLALVPPRVEKWSRRLRLELTFDSALAPAPAGVRGPAAADRHLVYSAADLTLDLALDRPEAAAGTVLMGELLRRSGEPVAGCPAALIAGGRMVAVAETGRLGEFQLACPTRERAELRLLVDGETLVEVPLGDSIHGGSDPG